MTAATVIYLLALAGVLGFLELWPEPNWLWNNLLYLPPAGWLLPLVVLTPLCWRVRPWLCALHFTAVAGVLFGYMHFRWSSWDEGEGSALTVVTANIGQRPRHTIEPFLDAEDPDVIAYQDAAASLRDLTAEYPDRFVFSETEFVLISKWPVRNVGFVEGLEHQGRPVVAWFELDFGGTSIVVYNVHMPTPRPYLMELRHHGMVANLAGILAFADPKHEPANEYWAERWRLMQGLTALLSEEKRPFLVVGDFNMSDHGYLYRAIASQTTDAFAARGRGWGFTFPDTTRDPLSFFGPWLRLDYLFAGHGWKPLYCRVESVQPGQHRAVATRFEFRNSN